MNTTLATLQSTLAGDIAAGTAANAAAITAAQTAILAQITASSMSTDANVTAKIAAAQTALETLINTGLASTNANVNTQVTAAQTALTALINTQLAAVQTALQQSIADGTTTTNAHTDAQIAALTAVINAGLIGVNTNIAGVSSQVSAAQTAILALVTSTSATLSNNIAAAQLALENLVNATATSTQNNINSTIASLQAALTVLINAGNGATIAQIQATQNAIVGGVGDTATSLTIHGLQLALQEAQAEIATLLAASAMYNGDVTIQSDADVDFYFGKVNQMGIINGNVSITTHGTTPVTEFTKLNTILGNIVAVIGVNSSTYSISTTANWILGFGAVTSVTLNVTPGTGHWVWVSDMNGDGLVMNHLNTVRGDYTVQGWDIDDSGLTQVGGTYTLNYTGNYEALLLASVGGNFILVDQPSNGTGYINFPIVTVDPAHFVGNGTPAIPVSTTVAFNSTHTTWINLGLATGAQINDLTANNATSIVLGTITPNGLTIHDNTVNSSTIDLSAATTSTGPITVVTTPGIVASVLQNTTLNLSNLTSSTGKIWASLWDLNPLHANNGVVLLDKFDSNVNVEIDGLLNVVNLSAWTANAGPALLIAPQATTVTLPLYKWLSSTQSLTIPTTAELLAVQTLTLGHAIEQVDLSQYTNLKTATITGATDLTTGIWANVNNGLDASHPSAITGAATPGLYAAGNGLSTLTLNGIFNTVVVQNLASLAHLTTTGVINSFTLNNTAIAAVNLGHSAFVSMNGNGGPGSDLTVTGNTYLAALTTTALDYMHTLTVAGNGPGLKDFNFASYHTDMFAGTVVISIDAPSVMGDYVHSIAPVSAANGGVQAIIKSNAIMTLKSYINAVMVDAHLPGSTFAINVGITTGSTTLNSVLGTESNTAWTPWGYTNLAAGGAPMHLTTQLGLVVAQ